MGRVYKALVKAQQWGDINKPIGQPDDTPQDSFQDLSGVGMDQPSASEPLFENFRRAAASYKESTEEGSYSDGMGARVSYWHNPTPAAQEGPSFRLEIPSISIRDLRIDDRLSAFVGDPQASEWYGALALNVLTAGVRRNLKTLVVTSPNSGEGKSTVAANLAWAMARTSGRRVLLLDCNLYHPSLSEKLGIPAEWNLMDLIESGDLPEDAIVSIAPNNLNFLRVQSRPASGSARRDSKFIGSRQAEPFLRRLCERFDLIVIDAPSLLESVDAQWLVSVTDGTAIVVRAGRTQTTSLVGARKLVPKGKRLGVVLNDFATSSRQVRKRRKAGFTEGWFRRSR